MEWSRNVLSYVVYFSENCENVMKPYTCIGNVCLLFDKFFL